MAKKVKIKICAGTHCYVMGGSELISLEDHLNDDQKEQVEIMGATCLNHCKDKDNSAPPYVEINDQIMAKANIPQILNTINKLLSDEVHK